MEAKVDVRKLQVLNDRINQTIDALNQVRLSVHGLGHTAFTQQNPFVTGQVPQYGMQPYGMQQPYGLGNVFGGGIGQGGFGQVGFPNISPFGTQGFQHSPFTPGYTPYMNPLTNPTLNPWNVTGTPWTGFGGGLLHSPPDILERQLVETRAADPYRISLTFPFVVS